MTKKDYICPKCNTIFTAKEHKEIRKQYPMICKYCGKSFYSFKVI